MRTHPCTCDEFAERLADYLEHDVDEATSAALESHALHCESCGTLLDEIRELRVAAAEMPALVPTRDLWSGIAERIAAPVVPLEEHRAATERGRGRFVAGRTRWAAMSAAAAALIVVSVGTTYLVMRGRGEEPPQRVATIAEPVPAPASGVSASPDSPPEAASAVPTPSARVAAPSERNVAGGRGVARLASNRAGKPTAEETYGREIAALRLVVAKRRPSLDTATIAVIEKNLAVIDSAIAQCRAALGKDPHSGFILQSLNSALETKVELLRTAATLPAHT